MPDLIFHLGITKTASTFLQRNVFHGKMNTLSRRKDREEDRKDARDFELFFRSRSPCVWRRGQVVDEFLPQVGENVRENILISHESLYEHVPFRPDNLKENILFEPYLLSSRLNEISRHCWPYGRVKVFFFFRKQVDWLPSIYAQVSHLLGKPSQRDFERRVASFLEKVDQGSQVLEYDLLIDCLKDALGERNVLAIPYEEFAKKATWEKICFFTGIDGLEPVKSRGEQKSNVRRSAGNQSGWRASEKAWFIRRVLSRGVFRPVAKRLSFGAKRRINELMKGSETRIDMPPSLAEEVQRFYEMSNRRCGIKLGLDLSQYGYY